MSNYESDDEDYNFNWQGSDDEFQIDSGDESDSPPPGLANLINPPQMVLKQGINARERAGEVVDKWILKMQSCCPEESKLREYAIPQDALYTLKKTVCLGLPHPETYIGRRVDNKIESYNSLAASLAYHLILSGKDRSKKLKEYNDLLYSKKKCSSDKDCNDIEYSRCDRRGICSYATTDLASVLRYEKLWKRCL